MRKPKCLLILLACLIGGISMLCIVNHFHYQKSMDTLRAIIKERDYAQLQKFASNKHYFLNNIPVSVQFYCAAFDAPAPDWPLSIACKYGDETAARILLDAGADPNYVPHMQSYYPLAIAAGTGNLNVVEVLLEYEANAEIQGFQAIDAYLKCRKKIPHNNYPNDIDAFVYLLDLLNESGFYIETKDGTGETLAFRAAVYGYIDVIQYFADKTELDLFIQNESSQTLLHVYVKSGYNTPHADGIRYLLNLGIDRNVRDVHGKKAYDYAVENGYTEIAGLLE